MERNVSLEEISDGRLYGLNDMVKADCNDCTGCSACCQGMGNSILLDPLDIFRFTGKLHMTFEELLIDKIELNVVDGIILPNLKMTGKTEKCVFLNEKGRCRIHSFRPGICRLFPLGRYYQNRSFRYFLQVHECQKGNKTKIKVRKWIDTVDVKKNEQYIAEWHYFLLDLQKKMKSNTDTMLMKQISMYVLQNFFISEYDTNAEFYSQFQERMEKAKNSLCGEVKQ